jgi:hypothetical protein
MLLFDRLPPVLPAALLLALTCLAPTASAQTSAVVLPWSVGDAEAARAASDAVTLRTTLSGAGVSVTSAEQSTSRFEQSGSVESRLVTASEIDRWLTHSREAVRALASGDYPAARQALAQAEELSERATAELNREEARARQVLDTCLYGVRAYVETSDPRAEERARDCRRLVPHIAPSPRVHTPEVVELLARVDQRAEASTHAPLTVESDPPGCLVRLNGVPMGTTPLATGSLIVGDYRVQVECGEGHRGRLHPIHVGEAPVTLRIEAHLDEAVRTEGTLQLAYHDAAAAAARTRDAAAIARVLGATEVWLVGREAGELVADRIDVASGRVIGTATLTTGIAEAVAGLLHAPAITTTASLGPDGSSVAPPTVVVRAPSTGPDPGAWALVGSGGAALVAGVVMIAIGVPDLGAAAAPRGSESFASAQRRGELAETLTGVGTALAGAGLILTTIGIVWAATSGGSGDVAVTAGPTGVSVSGTF